MAYFEWENGRRMADLDAGSPRLKHSGIDSILPRRSLAADVLAAGFAPSPATRSTLPVTPPSWGAGPTACRDFETGSATLQCRVLSRLDAEMA